MIIISDYTPSDFGVITKQNDLNLKFPCLSGYDLPSIKGHQNTNCSQSGLREENIWRRCKL